MQDSCTITLDEMPGWSSYAISTTKAASCTNGYELGKLDTARTVVERTPRDTATNGWLRVKFKAGSSDTTSGNVIIDSVTSGTKTVADLSTAKTLTMNVVNGNTMQGIWFTVAFLGNQNAGWTWAQPEGCWVNAGDSAKCTIDLTTTTRNDTVLTGANYTSFMGNIFKVYIEIFAKGFSSSVFFDDVVVDGSIVLHRFDKPQTFNVESGKNVVSANVVGRGSNLGIKTRAKVSGDRIEVLGDALRLTLDGSDFASVELFDPQGRLVSILHKGELATGTHSFSLKDVRKGLYVARAKGARLDATRLVLVK
jgi:hypothetical protein